ncbi:hypothetical protein ACFY7H_29425 [Streptomyces sp. NPDC012794]|uniref:hypothetical protein n=1 Tax=Streptomyces sp. NPDC012794 TaxID=3364850 RepID=UPI0036B83354
MFAVLIGWDRALAGIARRALADKDRLPLVEAWFRPEAGVRLDRRHQLAAGLRRSASSRRYSGTPRMKRPEPGS